MRTETTAMLTAITIACAMPYRLFCTGPQPKLAFVTRGMAQMMA